MPAASASTRGVTRVSAVDVIDLEVVLHMVIVLEREGDALAPRHGDVSRFIHHVGRDGLKPRGCWWSHHRHHRPHRIP